MSGKMLLAVAFGGAAGAVARYLVITRLAGWLGAGFPYGTMGVNVLGSFLMGLLVGLGAHLWQPSPEVRAFLVVGILGGFTTFSTFSLDVVLLVERQQIFAALAYIGLSVVLSVAALFGAMILIRGVMQ